MRALDIACPRCFALPDQDCVVPSGQTAFRVHVIRVEQAKRMGRASDLPRESR